MPFRHTKMSDLQMYKLSCIAASKISCKTDFKTFLKSCLKAIAKLVHGF